MANFSRLGGCRATRREHRIKRKSGDKQVSNLTVTRSFLLHSRQFSLAGRRAAGSALALLYAAACCLFLFFAARCKATTSEWVGGANYAGIDYGNNIVSHELQRMPPPPPSFNLIFNLTGGNEALALDALSRMILVTIISVRALCSGGNILA
jgi:hypothetical protein